MHPDTLAKLDDDDHDHTMITAPLRFAFA